MTAPTTTSSVSVTTDQEQEPAWKRELNHLPTPYPRGTPLMGDAAAQFTLRAVNAYGMGASIRDINGHTGRSFGAVRLSLLKAGVRLRGRGGARNGARPPVA
ncbi:helix-turn-helix domain-containing protein [Streptomyces mirabilis]|uniref:helix-turn-helix domain-containing protein n=1 Tax=Streptomyces mirabilis TaxID=68239 RepID=UPI003675615C